MNTITLEKPINNQSFFKLPLIFIAIFFVVSFGGMQIIRFFTIHREFDYFLRNLAYACFGYLLPLFLFFVTAVFCCQKYRLHLVSDSWLKVTLIAIIFSLLYIVWSILYGFGFTFIFTQLYESMDVSNIARWIAVFSFIMRIVTSILFIFILIFLFYLFANKDASLRAMFKLEGTIGSRVHAQVYSLLVLFLLIVSISYNLASFLRMMLDVDEIERLSIILAITLITLLIYYITFYFSTRDSFKRIESTVKLGKLIVTVLLTYLFLFISGLVIVGILFLFVWQFLYMGGSSMMTSLLTLFILSILINLLLSYVFSRLSVKIMYG